MAKGNASIFIYEGGPLEIPALIAVSDNALLLGLFNKKGRFEGQYLLNFEPLSLPGGVKNFLNITGIGQRMSFQWILHALSLMLTVVYPT